MPRQELGRWGKLYSTLAEDLAHYDDAQFRGAIAILCRSFLSKTGELPKLRPLRALHGADVVDRLIEEGFLEVDGQTVIVHNWPLYQAPKDDTAAERQRKHRESLRGQTVDNGSHADVTRDNRDDDTVTAALPSYSPSLSLSKNGVDEGTPIAGASYPVEGSDPDIVDDYYEITGARKWGSPLADWLKRLVVDHGRVNVKAALAVEFKADRNPKTLVGRVEARLMKQADRVASAKAREPKPVDPVQAQIKAALQASGHYDDEPIATGDPEAGRAAFEALRGSFGPRGGLPVGVGSVLPSRKNGNGRASSDPALTVDEGSGYTVGSGDVLPGVQSSDRAPSPPETGAALDPAPNRARPSRAVHSEASTDEAEEKEIRT